MTYDDDATQPHRAIPRPRPRLPFWKRLVLFLSTLVGLVLVGCMTLGLVALTPIAGGEPLITGLLPLTEEPGPTDTGSPPTPSDTQPPSASPETPATGPAATESLSPSPPGTDTEAPTLSPTPSDTPTPLPTPDDISRELHVPILMYHYVSAPPPDADVYRVDLSVPPENFYWQMRWLKENGYNVITLEHLFYYLNTGWPELPEKPIVLTFDDGYIDNYEYAFPVLQKFGFSGTFFILTDVTDRAQPGYMTWDMIREMHAAGMDIQVHGREHHDMSGRDRDWLIFHLLGPAQTIHANLGYQPRFLAYPSGRYDADVIAVAQEMGYWGAVTTTQGSLQSKDAPFEMRRLRVRGEWDFAHFIRIVQEYSG